MVLYKRKPVQPLPLPASIKDDDEIWYIQRTGEVFTTYDDYLSRMDFYKQKRFNCQITGHSNLSFFEALESERAGAAEVEQSFPEALKGPVLRRIQFQTVSRIDNLVDQIYDEFKADYHPGEAVTVLLYDGERFHGVVRDKTRYGSKVLPDGTLTPPYTRYIVSLDSRPGDEAMVEESNIFRDRKVFTKSVLRSFIKKTVSREAWTGAPWLVKHDVADQYHIDTRVPSSLRYDTKVMERKQMLAQKRLSQQSPDIAHILNSSPGSPGSPDTPMSSGGGLRLPELKPSAKSHKAKHIQLAQQQKQYQQHLQKQQQDKFQNQKQKQHKLSNSSKARPDGFAHHSEPGQFQHLPLPNNPFQFTLSMRNQALTPPGHAAPEVPALPPPPPPPKYPIEDLQLEPNGTTRPALKFLCRDPPVKVDVQSGSESPYAQKIDMESVGPLLETWDTLNVYCEIFKLDSFTFDDFIETLLSANGETPVQLFDEIHCSVLKTLVKSSDEGGEVQIKLPQMGSDDSEDEDDEDEDEEEEEELEPEPKPMTRATRSSVAKQEAERLAAEAAAAEKERDEPVIVHRAEDVLADYDWVEELRKRDFRNGRWQLMIVGLLYQLSKDERHRASCEELLAQIVPPNVEATEETLQQHFMALDIKYRAKVLQIMCMLTMETKAIRGYMEDCSEQMTKYRKEKIEWQRKRKQAIEDLKVLNDQRKIQLPNNLPPSPPQEPAKTDVDMKMSDAEDFHSTGMEDGGDSEEETRPAPRGRSLRRADDRAAERRRKHEEELERKREAEAAAKAPKQSKQFIKLLRDIEKKEAEIKECEDEIATLDNDLREADCPRTRVLGKDRFWNRYYWFERNGMPYGGLPTSSTAEADYANGCIWVQGPDELEHEGYITMTPELQDEYKAKFNMTVPERKKLEEGATGLSNARQWGYISEPEDLDALINWLDMRGFNELKLRKELVTFRSKIIANMENRKKYLASASSEASRDDQESKADSVENATGAASSSNASKRMSTRTRGAVPTPEPTPPPLRCVQWMNSMALEDLGHIHSEEPPPARPRKQNRKRESATAVEPEPPRKKTRQGQRSH